MSTIHTYTLNGVTYTLDMVQEDHPVTGNAMASGDHKVDREAETEILLRLDAGDFKAWATLMVTAQVDGFQGVDYLGCCSFAPDANDTTILETAKDHGMFEEARADLLRTLQGLGPRVKAALAMMGDQ